MRKRSLVLAAAIVLIVSLLCGSAAFAAVAAFPTVPAPASTPVDIGEDGAKAAAFADAGLTEADIAALEYLRVKKDVENGRPVYDVEFVLGNTEYDYEIDRANAAVVSRDRDIETYTAETVPPSANDIGTEAAKAAALTAAGLTDADIAKLGYLFVWADTENGKPVYEVEFVLDGMEYDYEIDRATGSVLSWDTDIEGYDRAGFPSNGADVGEQSAIDAALAKVKGATGSDVRIHSDFDDGRRVYEGRVVYNGIEYEFEIDAETGRVLEWDAERYDPYDDDDRYDDDWDDDRYDDDDDWDDDRWDDDDDDDWDDDDD